MIKKHKNICFFIAISWLLTPSFGFPDTVFLKNGTRFDVGETWEENGKIKFKMYGSIVDFPKEDVLEIKKTNVKEDTEETSKDCYDLGYRFGLCATKSIYGIPCEPENDIIIPEMCRKKDETNRGINAGATKVRDILKINSAGTKSSASLDILTTPIDILDKRLKGKTKNEIKNIVGMPDRIEIFGGNKCWIYGNTYSTKDRGIVFVGDEVLTVTFY